MSNADLIESATNDARNKAALKGADFLRLNPPQLVTNTDKGVTMSASATVTGTAYNCRAATAAPSPEARPAPKAQPSKAPNSAAGFTFGWAVDRAKRACEDAKQTWSANGGDFGCSGPATASGVGEIRLAFCKGKLCRITLKSTPEDGAWAAAHRELRSKLEAKYGTPEGGGTVGAPECKDRLEDCLRDGRAKMSANWTFEDDVTISLVTGTPKEGGPPAVRVSYQASRGGSLDAGDL